MIRLDLHLIGPMSQKGDSGVVYTALGDLRKRETTCNTRRKASGEVNQDC